MTGGCRGTRSARRSAVASTQPPEGGWVDATLFRVPTPEATGCRSESETMPATQRFESRARFKAPPEALWPLVADTPTINRAIGLPPIEFQVTPQPAGAPTIEGQIRMLGVPVARCTEH